MRGSLGAALLIGAVVFGTTFAGNARAEDACALECYEARRVCHRAARAAYHVCHQACDDAVVEAAERARRICHEQQLGPRQCLELILHAAREAVQGCHERCRAARHAGRARCAEERLECREACDAPLDGQCVDVCLEDFGVCRDDLGSCTGACEASAEETLTQCRELVGEGIAFRRCVREVRREARTCVHACHQELPCAEDFRHCLGDCVIEP